MEDHLVPGKTSGSNKGPLANATGYPYAHYDCPHCGDALEFEGDTRGERLTCDNCLREFEG